MTLSHSARGLAKRTAGARVSNPVPSLPLSCPLLTGGPARATPGAMPPGCPRSRSPLGSGFRKQR